MSYFIIPNSVLVGSIIYRVTQDSGEWVSFEYKHKINGFLGHTDHEHAIIYLNPKCPPDVTRLTLWHEILHALCQVVAGRPDWLNLGEDQNARDESVIQRLESPTLLVLRDNPQLVTYLTSAA